MIEQLADDVRMVATPAREAHLYVLGSRTLSGVLLEMGFLSNRRDEALLRQSAHRRVLVRAIRDAIDDYFAATRVQAQKVVARIRRGLEIVELTARRSNAPSTTSSTRSRGIPMCAASIG